MILRKARELGEHRRGEEESGRHADLRPAAVEAAPTRRRVLDRHQHGAAPLAADAKPLRQTQQHDERDGGPRPDLRVGRQQADAERRDAHDDQRQHEHRLAADAVAVVADDDAADRPRDEADRVGAERRQRPRQRIERRERTAG